MMDLVRLALTLAGTTPTPPPRRSLTRTAAVAGLAALSAVAGLAALGTAAAGLWIWVRPFSGPAGAAAIVALAFLIVALAAMVAAQQTAQGRTPAAPPPSPAGAGGASDLLLTEAARLVKTHKVPVLIGALVVGALAGLRER